MQTEELADFRLNTKMLIIINAHMKMLKILIILNGVEQMMIPQRL